MILNNIALLTYMYICMCDRREKSQYHIYTLRVNEQQWNNLRSNTEGDGNMSFSSKKKERLYIYIGFSCPVSRRYICVGIVFIRSLKRNYLKNRLKS
jgi:hypothetical protein